MDELKAGFKKLLALSLEDRPGHDVIAGTLLVWAEAIGMGRQFSEDIDAPRFRAAFAQLIKKSRRWPAPADFIEALPKKITYTVAAARLEDQKRQEVSERVRNCINEIADKFKLEPKT